MGPGKDTQSTLGPEKQEGCGWPVWIRQQMHGTHGGGAGRAEWLGSTCGRHDEETDDECVGLPLKHGVFPSMVITNSSCNGVDYEWWSVIR